jgi:hypothetical protein
MDTGKTPTKDAPKGSGRRTLTVVGVLGAIAVNIAAFMLSADAITTVAKAAGISASIAWAMVLSVDGMMLTGTVVFVTRKIMGRSARYPGIVLSAGVLLSVACNALHAKASGGHMVHLGGNTRAAVSAIPAASLAFSFHLIADMVKDSLGVTKPSSASFEALPERPSTPVFERLSEVSFERPSQRLPETPEKTPERPSVARPKTPRKTPTPAARKTPAKPAKDTRTEARKILKANPDMPAAEVARQLGKKPSGYMRTMCADVLQELRDAGEIPSVRAIGA